MKSWFGLLALTLMLSAAAAQPAAAAPTTAASGYEDEAFSFQPPNPCRMPPKTPPKKLLDKKYDIQGLEDLYTPNWLIFDVNGDGICDWVREAVEQTIYDVDIVSEKDSIFIGTKDDWRYWKPLKDSLATGEIDIPIGAVVYRNGDPKPIVVYYQTLNARNPSIDVSSFSPEQWDASAVNLMPIGGTEAAEVIDFLRVELCRRKRGEFGGIIGNAERLTNSGPGSLCGPRNN